MYLSDIKLSVNRVFVIARAIVTIQIRLPYNNEIITKTMLMKQHQRIAPLFTDDFGVTR